MNDIFDVNVPWNGTPIISKSANLSCIPNSTKPKKTSKRTGKQWNWKSACRIDSFKIICCGPNLHGEKKIKW